jgi:hypothetical protein
MGSLFELRLMHGDHEPNGPGRRDSVLECARCCAAFAFNAHLKAPEHWALQDLSAVGTVHGKLPTSKIGRALAP